jgi:hypothetical protein
MEILGLLVGSWISSNSGSQAKKPIPLYATQAEMKAEIAKRIPVDSSIESARKTMTENNFVCQVPQEHSFVEIDDNNSQTIHKNIDYLYCTKQVPGFPCAIKWQVALVENEKLIQSVLVSKSSICL